VCGARVFLKRQAQREVAGTENAVTRGNAENPSAWKGKSAAGSVANLSRED